jgi:hypothetical protein
VAEVAAAKARHLELQRESRDLERKIKKQREEVESAVRETFSKAIQDGVATLAQSEVIKFLVSPAAPIATAPTPAARVGSSDEPVDIDFAVTSKALTRPQGVAQLSKLGLGRRRAEILVDALSILGRASVCLVLRGVDARQHAKVLGRIDSDSCGFLEVPMGLSSSSPVSNAIRRSSRLNALVVQNADLSPIEIYAAPIFDHLVEASINDEAGVFKVVLSCSGGDLALPLPKVVSRCGVFVDVDKPWGQDEQSLEELDEKDIPLMRAMIGKILNELAALEGPMRRGVESLIVQSFTGK